MFDTSICLTITRAMTILEYNDYKFYSYETETLFSLLGNAYDRSAIVRNNERPESMMGLLRNSPFPNAISFSRGTPLPLHLSLLPPILTIPHNTTYCI
jgi:hypothetical protein